MISRACRAGLRTMLVAAWLAASTPAQAAALSFDQVRAAYRSSETVLLDRHGVPVQTVRTDTHARRGAWVPLAQISPALRAAAIASEDQRFMAARGRRLVGRRRAPRSGARTPAARAARPPSRCSSPGCSIPTWR